MSAHQCSTCEQGASCKVVEQELRELGAHPRLEESSCQEVGPARGELPLEIPAHHTAAARVARAAHYVRARLCLLPALHARLCRGPRFSPPVSSYGGACGEDTLITTASPKPCGVHAPPKFSTLDTMRAWLIALITKAFGNTFERGIIINKRSRATAVTQTQSLESGEHT